MKKKITEVERLMRNEQPINWGRCVVTGVLASWMMMGFIDSFAMMGLTDFSYERYVGSVFFVGDPQAYHSWTLGFILNSLMGAVFALFYAYFFEFVFGKAKARLGTLLGIGHTALAAVAIFPFFNMAHEFMGTELYPGFGILGSGINAGTPILILAGHLLFGATVGLLYGPVRVQRIRAREFEPEETGTEGEVVQLAEYQEDVRSRVSYWA